MIDQPSSKDSSPAEIREYDAVRVVKLLRDDREYMGGSSVARAPRIGDVAVVCHEYSPGNLAALLAFELVDADGYTIWLADFERSELERIS